MLLAAAFFVISFPVSDFYYYGDSDAITPSNSSTALYIDTDTDVDLKVKSKAKANTHTSRHAPVHDIGNDSHSSSRDSIVPYLSRRFVTRCTSASLGCPLISKRNPNYR